MENAAILASAWQSPILLIDPYNEGQQFVVDTSNSIIGDQAIVISDNL